MISKDEVKHISKLARLELTDQEIEKMQKDLSAVLDYFELLKKAPKPKIKKETASAFGRTESASGETKSAKATASQRKDEVMAKNPNMAGDLIKAAPEQKDGYIKVKAVL